MIRSASQCRLSGLGLSIAAALLAGCGGSQPPIGAPGAVSQAPAVAVRVDNTKYKVLYSFGGFPDGEFPDASLIDVGGTLYGTTENGGPKASCTYNYPFWCGTIFSITPSGTETVLHTFGARNDGYGPVAGLIDVDGTLYGTTSGGGSYGACLFQSGGYYWPCGTVFSITPSGTEKVLHNFGGKADGINPVAALIEVNGVLYGTTENGGAYHVCRAGCGKVFSIKPDGTYEVLHNFRAESDGAAPAASLIDVKGTLYGTTAAGGVYHGGTVFSMTPSGKEKVLHSFGKGKDGYSPSAGLIDVSGTLYGTTSVGGARNCDVTNRCGTVFSITPSGTERVLHRFAGGADGGDPVAPLINVNGTLYGTTEYGGAYRCSGGGCGTIFSITAAGAERVLHSFASKPDGAEPQAGLVELSGILYGTTQYGGKSGHGTVFELKP